MIEKMKNIESSLIFVNFMTGLTAFLLGIIFIWILKMNVPTEQVTKFLFDELVVELALVFLLVLFGFFVYGIRYFFFDLYRTKIHPKVKERQRNKNEKRLRKGKEIPKEFKHEEGHSIISWFIKYAFRNGTTVEEAIAANKRWKSDMAKKHKTDEFDWIGTSNYPSFDMWKYANYINNRHQEANIYRFYYHSEVFQCLDTLFLTMFIVSFVKCLFMFATSSFNSTAQEVVLCGYVLCMFTFHLLSKVSGKACIRRFFLEIAVGLTDCKDIFLPNQNAESKEYDQK